MSSLPNGPGSGADESVAGSSPTTLSGVLEAYVTAGFFGSFTTLEGARLECHECGEIMPAASLTMTSLRRLEGASDPDDMLAVVALACPRCGTQGTLVLGYGPAASPEDGDVLAALRDERNTSEHPGNSAPGEVTGDDSTTGR